MPSQTPSDTSAILGLPYLMPAQAQKHVTHNEALRILDMAVQLAVLDRDRSTPPAGAAEGECHIVAAGAGGAWAGRAGQVAAFVDGGWEFLAPRPGWRAQVLAEGVPVVWDGSAWTDQVGMLGVNTPADAFNRLAVAAPATLFTHEGGDHQLKVNKAADTDTASLLFQSGWTGYAEMGLAGDTNFSIKAFDGTDWFTAIAVDGAGRSVQLEEQLVVRRGPASGATLILQKAADSNAAAANIQCTRMRGSFEAPDALQNDTVFTQLAVNGFDGTAFTANSGSMSFKAAQDWEPGKQGTRFTIEVTRNDTRTRYEAFTIEDDGNALLAGALTTGNADIAEMFENRDPGEIPPGTIVAESGGRVHAAGEGDAILGVISETAALVGGDAPFGWAQRHLRDEWGRLLMERVPDPGHGGAEPAPLVLAPCVNPAWDPDRPQASRRARRDEWSCVGLLGQVLVRVDAKVRPGDRLSAQGGIGVKARARTGLRCMAITSPFEAARGYAIARCLVNTMV